MKVSERIGYVAYGFLREKRCIKYTIKDCGAQLVVTSCRTDHCVLLLPGEERELRLNEENFERAAALLRRVPEFTIAAALRQEEANSGTIVAFAHGNNRYEIPKSSFPPTPQRLAFENFGLDGCDKQRAVTYFKRRE